MGKNNDGRRLPNFQDVFVCVTKKHLVNMEHTYFFPAAVERDYLLTCGTGD